MNKSPDAPKSLPLPERFKDIVREADSAILKMAGESHHLIYRLIHKTVAKIARVDSFYVGFYVDGNMMVFPYSYDEKAYYDPNKAECKPDGLGTWVLNNRRPYWYGMDDGFLMRKGLKYGKRKSSQDCVLVPVFEHVSGPRGRRANSSVLAVIGTQSYEPASYDEECVQALEWLANDLTLVLQREREDKLRRRRIGGSATTGERYMLNPESIVNQMLEKMAVIRRKGDALSRILAEEGRDMDDPLSVAVEALCQECEKRQTETIELFLQSTLAEGNPLIRLTDTERQIARILVQGFMRSKEGYSDNEISQIFGAGMNTVKTHLSKIYTKLGVSGRTGANELLKPYTISD